MGTCGRCQLGKYPETADEWVHVAVDSWESTLKQRVNGYMWTVSAGNVTRNSWCMAKAGCVNVEGLKDVGGWVDIVNRRRSRVRVDRRVSAVGRIHAVSWNRLRDGSTDEAWSSLPQDLRHCSTLSSFKAKLKTLISSQYYRER